MIDYKGRDADDRAFEERMERAMEAEDDRESDVALKTLNWVDCGCSTYCYCKS